MLRYSSIRILCFLLVLVVNGIVTGQETSTWPYEDEMHQEQDARMQWWRQARFGLFIHWGVYAVPAGTYNGQQISGIGEWIMRRAEIPVQEYKAYAKEFNPVKYDPDAWVRLAKEAGMKYIIITSKHHDGFALFDSKVTDWDVVDATPYGKDLLKPLAQACRKHGIKLGFYYSQSQDWCHPGGGPTKQHWDTAQDGSMDEYIQNIAVPQVREILTNYGDIAVLWWDTPGSDMAKERADILQPLLKLQPGIITNNRLGGGYLGDTETPEQHIPATGFKDRDWETCMTMNDTWGYKSDDHNWKTTKKLLRNLVDIASKGGNFLLNVGPTPEGEIPQPSIERLRKIGQWMKVNGESIYGTTATPFAKLIWGRCTKKVTDGNVRLYLHVFQWPTDGKLLMAGLKNEAANAYLLANGQLLKTVLSRDGLVIFLPEQALDKIDTVLVVDVQGQMNIEKVITGQDDRGAVILPAALANIHNHLGANTQVEEKDSRMNIGYWTSSGVTVDWDFRIDRPGTFQIFADVAVASAQTHFNVKLADQNLNVIMKSTGGYDTFQERALGQVQIQTAGAYEIVLVPDKDKWQPMNIRSMKLELLK